MITNEELYGTTDVPRVPVEVCDGRLALLKGRLKAQMSLHYSKQDNALVTKLTKAIKFWYQLRDGDESYE